LKLKFIESQGLDIRLYILLSWTEEKNK